MNNLTKPQKVANILAFLAILGDEDVYFHDAVMRLSPDYIIEKFERYVESTRVEYPWGIHPVLKQEVFQRYVDKWKLELSDE